jgi:hypothetical protein
VSEVSGHLELEKQNPTIDLGLDIEIIQEQVKLPPSTLTRQLVLEQLESDVGSWLRPHPQASFRI